MKLKDSKVNHRDKLHISSEKNFVENLYPGDRMYTCLDESPWEKNLAETQNYDNLPNQWSSKEGYCSAYSSAFQGIFEPESISSPKEGYTSANVASAPSSCYRNSMEIDTK